MSKDSICGRTAGDAISHFGIRHLQVRRKKSSLIPEQEMQRHSRIIFNLGYFSAVPGPVLWFIILSVRFTHSYKGMLLSR